ncbi:MAG: hypothetical protein PHO02_04505 [Candidatus Nanoarchaeia archaeon]|nr:hypothetical protein [Candidatus Nanoarchaeia archaeon]
MGIIEQVDASLIKKQGKELDTNALNKELFKTRKKIKREVERVLLVINQENRRLYTLIKKHPLNNFNQAIFNDKTSQIVKFNEGLIATWRDTLRLDKEKDSEDSLLEYKY